MARGASRRPTEFCLRFEQRVTRLHVGELVIGRGLACDVVLDDSKVSRQHARLTVSEQGVQLTDLGSVNGSHLNGQQLAGQTRELAVGDQMRFGHCVLELASKPLPSTASGTHAVPPVEARPSAVAVLEEDIPTRRVEALDVAGAGAEMAFAAGRPDQAERLLAGYLATVADEIHAHRDFPDRIVDEAVRLALRLAEKTAKAAWFDYAIDLLRSARRTPTEHALAELCDLGSRLPIDRAKLRQYLDERGAAGSVGLAQLAALVRA